MRENIRKTFLHPTYLGQIRTGLHCAQHLRYRSHGIEGGDDDRRTQGRVIRAVNSAVIVQGQQQL
jgi:hypothetical protein